MTIVPGLAVEEIIQASENTDSAEAGWLSLFSNETLLCLRLLFSPPARQQLARRHQDMKGTA